MGREVETFGSDHVKSPNTHGSGCTFSSAIAAQLASGQQLREAVILAKAYVTKAIEKSYQIGKGRRAAQPAVSDSTRKRRRAASTKCRSMGCIPPQSLPRTSQPPKKRNWKLGKPDRLVIRVDTQVRAYPGKSRFLAASRAHQRAVGTTRARDFARNDRCCSSNGSRGGLGIRVRGPNRLSAYCAAAVARASMTAILWTRLSGRLWRCFRYCGAL